MRTYDDVRQLVGTTEECGSAGGRTRFLHWEGRAVSDRYAPHDPPAIAARLFGTDVATFYPLPQIVAIRTGGHVTATTFDGIATALGVGRGHVGTVHRVPYVMGHRLTEGMLLDRRGKRLRDAAWGPHAADWLNQCLSPLAGPRGAWLDVVDVSDDGGGALRVTVAALDGGPSDTSTARNLARAYVGRLVARTSIVNRLDDRTTFRVAS